MQEQFIYSLMASALGIIIVFTILVLLSGLMILIRKLSDTDPEKKKKSAKPAPKTTNSSDIPLPVLVGVATAATAVVGSANWIAAAVAAFLAAEDDETVIPRAANWAARKNNSFDPWVNRSKLSNSAPGV